MEAFILGVRVEDGTRGADRGLGTDIGALERAARSPGDGGGAPGSQGARLGQGRGAAGLGRDGQLGLRELGWGVAAWARGGGSWAAGEIWATRAGWARARQGEADWARWSAGLVGEGRTGGKSSGLVERLSPRGI